MKKNFIISLILVLFISSKVFAEDNLVSAIDFKEAIAIALQNNDEIIAMQSALSTTERDIGISRSAMMPKVRVGEDFITINNPAQVFALKLN